MRTWTLTLLAAMLIAASPPESCVPENDRPCLATVQLIGAELAPVRPSDGLSWDDGSNPDPAGCVYHAGVTSCWLESNDAFAVDWRSTPVLGVAITDIEAPFSVLLFENDPALEFVIADTFSVSDLDSLVGSEQTIEHEGSRLTYRVVSACQ